MKDLFCCSPNDEKLAMSMADEKVLEFYIVQNVVLENGQTHLQLKLPWTKDSNNLQNNYAGAKSALLSLQTKLNNQPKLRSKYSEKIETAI